MYPSFTTTNSQLKHSSLYNYINNTNLSKTHGEDYSFQLHSPHNITLDEYGNMIFNELLQQDSLFSNNHHVNHISANNIVVHHQELSSQNIRAGLQSSMGKSSNNNIGDDDFNKPKIRRKRASKTDRHSKINTAQGPRDRRMRLSLDVSKKFFKLQDMLGFDTASKTVEWLLMKSKSYIQELIPHGKSSFLDVSISESSTSKCKLLSEYVDGDRTAKCSSTSNRIKGKKKARRGVRKSSYLLRPLAKETRELARKRARERTLEKSIKLSCVSDGDDQFSKFRPYLDLAVDQAGVNRFGSWVINQLPDEPLQNKGVSPTIAWNPSFVFNYSQEHQASDFQILGSL